MVDWDLAWFPAEPQLAQLLALSCVQFYSTPGSSAAVAVGVLLILDNHIAKELAQPHQHIPSLSLHHVVLIMPFYSVFVML